MFFYNRIQRIVAQVMKFRKYRRMPPILAILLAIFLLPFAIGFFVTAGLAYLACIFYGFVETPTKNLHKILHDEGQEVKHATQCVMYLFSWPLLFFLYFWCSFLSFAIVVFYFLAQTCGFIFSLCDFKFHISPLDEDIEKPVTLKKYVPVSIIYIVLCAIYLIGWFIYMVLLNSAYYADYLEEFFLEDAIYYSILFLIGYMIFTLIYIPCAFKSNKKAKELPANENKDAEPKKAS